MLGKLNLLKLDERFRKTDHFMLDILGIRLADLSELVVENKLIENKGKPFSKRRLVIEDKRIKRMKKWAEEKKINPNFAAGLMYSTMAESCLVQDEVYVDKTLNHEKVINEDNPKIRYAIQRENLLRLTSAVAEIYDKEYGKDHLGSEHYFRFEKKVLGELIAEGLPDNSLAIDLGCATGIMSFEVAKTFEKVIGYEISPAMIKAARKKLSKKNSHIQFIKKDIENGINLQMNSVSLVIMNMGTASDIKDFKKVLTNLQYILKPGGKFFFSFYNSESLLAKTGFIPWPLALAAHIDNERRCLAVRCDGEIYSIYAHPRSVNEIQNLISKSGFEIDNICTYPTFASILPDIITTDYDEDGNSSQNEEVRKLIRKIDTEIARSIAIHPGTYIIVTGGKSSK